MRGPTFLVGPVGHDEVQDVGVQVLVLGPQDAEHQAGSQLDALLLVLVDGLAQGARHMTRHMTPHMTHHMTPHMTRHMTCHMIPVT